MYKRQVNSLGPKNTGSYNDDVERENVFAVLSGREAGVEGPTSLPLEEDKEGGATPSNNAENKVGEFKEKETPSGKKVDALATEGVSKAQKVEGAFANRGASETVTMTNGCDNDALSDVTHTVGSFLKTINSLTEYAGQYVDTSRNLLVDIDLSLIHI